MTTLAQHSLLTSFSFQPHLIWRKVASDFSSCIFPPVFWWETNPAQSLTSEPQNPLNPQYIFATTQRLTLQALERDLGGLNKTSWDEGAVYGAVRYGASSASGGGGNTASWEGEDDEETSLNSLTMPDLVDSREPGGPSLAALRHLKSDDIDMFIANMAVPPPPSVVRQQQASFPKSKHLYLDLNLLEILFQNAKISHLKLNLQSAGAGEAFSSGGVDIRGALRLHHPASSSHSRTTSRWRRQGGSRAEGGRSPEASFVS